MMIRIAVAILLPCLASAQDFMVPLKPDVLFWSQSERDAFFPKMERVFPVRSVHRGARVHPLPLGHPLDASWMFEGKKQDVASYMRQENTAGLLVLQNGAIRLERYALGYGSEGRWTSFSVAKSVTSTLVGAAIKDGYIRSIDDPVVRYLPDLKNSAYEDVSIRQLLTMTSGVRWNEDYSDPKSDVATFSTVAADPGVDQTVSYMRKLPREVAPGTHWVYKTGETNLVGVLVAEATHQTLSDYLSEKIWRPYGMQQDAVWMIGSDGNAREPGGCCLSAALRDFARFGQFVLDGGRAGGKEVVPKDWFEMAGRTQIETDQPGQGYGFQWWTNADGSFDARGIFGQLIHIDPRQKLVVVMSSSWPSAVGLEHTRARTAMLAAIAAAAQKAP